MHDLSGITSIGIVAKGPLDPYRFNMFITDLLLEKSRDIFRSKGVLCLKGKEHRKFVFQGVHESVKYGALDSKWPENDQGE